jgi:hypothetical protein
MEHTAARGRQILALQMPLFIYPQGDTRKYGARLRLGKSTHCDQQLPTSDGKMLLSPAPLASIRGVSFHPMMIRPLRTTSHLCCPNLEAVEMNVKSILKWAWGICELLGRAELKDVVVFTPYQHASVGKF